MVPDDPFHTACSWPVPVGLLRSLLLPIPAPCLVGQDLQRAFCGTRRGLGVIDPTEQVVVASCTTMVVSGQSVGIAGSLRSTDGESLAGTVDISVEGAELVVTTHIVECCEDFRISAPTQHGILVHVSTEGRPPFERLLPPGTIGQLLLDIKFPEAQQLSGRILDAAGRGIADATVHVRYHAPGQSVRRAAFHVFQQTDRDGYFQLSDVGVGVPFFVDTHVVGHRPVSFGPMVRENGHTDMGNLVRKEEERTVVVQLHDRNGEAVPGALVVPQTDPAGYRPQERGSLLHDRAFHQRTNTSPSGIARFAGVPHGRIRIHAEIPDGEARFRGAVAETQIVEIQMAVPWPGPCGPVRKSGMRFATIRCVLVAGGAVLALASVS